MVRSPPQFRSHIKLTFEEHGKDRSRKFGFHEGHRRLPMSMDGVDGLHTVGLWIEKSDAVFEEGDEFDADCRVIWPEGFRDIVAPGVKFRLWDAGFFAHGTVTERYDGGWEDSA
jgi:hypothetical protein